MFLVVNTSNIVWHCCLLFDKYNKTMRMQTVAPWKRFYHPNVSVATFHQRIYSFRCNFSRVVNLPHNKLPPYKDCRWLVVLVRSCNEITLEYYEKTKILQHERNSVLWSLWKVATTKCTRAHNHLATLWSSWKPKLIFKLRF